MVKFCKMKNKKPRYCKAFKKWYRVSDMFISFTKMFDIVDLCATEHVTGL